MKNKILNALKNHFYTILLIGAAVFVAFFSIETYEQVNRIQKTQELYNHMHNEAFVQKFIDANTQSNYISQPNVFNDFLVLNEIKLAQRSLTHSEFLNLCMQKFHPYLTPDSHLKIKNRPYIPNMINRQAYLLYGNAQNVQDNSGIEDNTEL